MTKISTKNVNLTLIEIANFFCLSCNAQEVFAQISMLQGDLLIPILRESRMIVHQSLDLVLKNYTVLG